jgi:C6 transcription factor Pro1
MGCKNWVMLLIMEIAMLDDWKKTRQKSGNLSLRELTSKAAHIEDRLTAGMNKTLDEPISIYKDSCGIRTSESRCVTYIFACSALTYLHVTVSGAHPDLPEIRESIARSIKAFQNLPDPIWVRHLVWPFCIAGCMAAADEQDVFREIANGAYLDGQIFGNFEKALKIMERSWQGRQEQENGCTPWDWKSSMDSLGQMVLLI